MTSAATHPTEQPVPPTQADPGHSQRQSTRRWQRVVTRIIEATAHVATRLLHPIMPGQPGPARQDPPHRRQEHLLSMQRKTGLAQQVRNFVATEPILKGGHMPDEANVSLMTPAGTAG